MRVQISMKLEDTMLALDFGWDAEDDSRIQRLVYKGFDTSEMPRNNRHPKNTEQGFDFHMNPGAHGVN